jgi:hypothetical protein
MRRSVSAPRLSALNFQMRLVDISDTFYNNFLNTCRLQRKTRKNVFVLFFFFNVPPRRHLSFENGIKAEESLLKNLSEY